MLFEARRASTLAILACLQVPYLVGFQVPALDHLVQATAEHVRVAGTDSEAGDLFNMPRQREPQLAAGQVPDLDGAVCRARAEPLVAGVKGHRAHPPVHHGILKVYQSTSEAHVKLLQNLIVLWFRVI